MGGFGEAPVDDVLGHSRLTGSLANEDALGVAPGAIENLCADKFVIKDDVGGLQRLQGS